MKKSFHFTKRGKIMAEWTVYILKCRDDTLYTGITDNFPRRLAAHNRGTGAKYTRGRGPVMPLYRETCPDKSAALKREIAKALSNITIELTAKIRLNPDGSGPEISFGQPQIRRESQSEPSSAGDAETKPSA